MSFGSILRLTTIQMPYLIRSRFSSSFRITGWLTKVFDAINIKFQKTFFQAISTKFFVDWFWLEEIILVLVY